MHVHGCYVRALQRVRELPSRYRWFHGVSQLWFNMTCLRSGQSSWIRITRHCSWMVILLPSVTADSLAVGTRGWRTVWRPRKAIPKPSRARRRSGAYRQRRATSSSSFRDIRIDVDA
jgi:hypothetical protein